MAQWKGQLIPYTISMSKPKQEPSNEPDRQASTSSKRFDDYDPKWKREILLADFEFSNLVILDSEELQHTPTDNLNFDSEVLHFLDDPGLKIPAINNNLQTFFSYFLNNDNFFSSLTDATNRLLLEVIMKDVRDNAQHTFNKKKYKETELQQLLALRILFGIFRMPMVDDHWHAPLHLRGGPETCMMEGRFKFLDAHLLLPTNDPRLQQAVNQLHKKLQTSYKPDQELLLAKIVIESQSTLLLLDAETSLIIDLFIIEDLSQPIASAAAAGSQRPPGQSSEQNDAQPEPAPKPVDPLLNPATQSYEKHLFIFLKPYFRKNHIIYILAEPTPSFESLLQLAEQQIFPVAQVPLNTPTERIPSYLTLTHDLSCAPSPLLHPKKNLIKPTNYPRKFQSLAQQASLFLELLQSHRLTTISASGYLRRKLDEIIEALIHNSFMLLRAPAYKQHRHNVAKLLLGEKAAQLERDRKEARRRIIATYSDATTNTERLAFGLKTSYTDPAIHTPLPHNGADSFKYCPVCMKMDGLTKPHFRCLACEKLLPHPRIFLCAFPCFDFFHQNPTDFLHCNIETLTPLGESKYFKNEPVTLQLAPPPEIEEPKKKGGGLKNLVPKLQGPFFSYNKELYKDKYLEDKDLETILNSLKKPPAPSPANLQPIIGASAAPQNGAEREVGGHRRDMQLFDGFSREAQDKREERGQRMQDAENHGQSGQGSSPPMRKKDRKLQKLSQEAAPPAEAPEGVSPFEQFMAQIKKKTKQEQ